MSGQVQLTSMIGNDDLVYFDIDDDNTVSIAYTAIDYQYDGSWDRNEKTVFETYDSELARTSQFLVRTCLNGFLAKSSLLGRRQGNLYRKR